MTHPEHLDEVLAVYLPVHVRLGETEVAHRAETQPEVWIAHGELSHQRVGRVILSMMILSEVVCVRGCVYYKGPARNELEEAGSRFNKQFRYHKAQELTG